MSTVYDNCNERVKIEATPEDTLRVFVGNSMEAESSTTFVIDVPTAEDLCEGLRTAIDHVKAKKRSTDGY